MMDVHGKDRLETLKPTQCGAAVDAGFERRWKRRNNTLPNSTAECLNSSERMRQTFARSMLEQHAIAKVEVLFHWFSV